MKQATRGERNCNPGNLRYNPRINWYGLATPPQDEGGYCVFVSPGLGLRALCRDLYIANTHDGLKSVAEMVHHFAPPSENNTQAYIQDVSDRLGIYPDAALDLSDPGKLQTFAHAVILHENGRCIYPDTLIAAAVEQALR